MKKIIFLLCVVLYKPTHAMLLKFNARDISKFNISNVTNSFSSIKYPKFVTHNYCSTVDTTHNHKQFDKIVTAAHERKHDQLKNLVFLLPKSEITALSTLSKNKQQEITSQIKNSHIEDMLIYIAASVASFAAQYPIAICANPALDYLTESHNIIGQALVFPTWIIWVGLWGGSMFTGCLMGWEATVELGNVIDTSIVQNAPLRVARKKYQVIDKYIQEYRSRKMTSIPESSNK